MVEAEFGGDYLSVDTTKDNDIAVITGKPEFGELTFQGKVKKVTNIPVEVYNKKLIYTPGNKSGKTLVKAWGKEMDNWVGKKFQIFHIDDKLVIRPIVEEKSSER